MPQLCCPCGHTWTTEISAGACCPACGVSSAATASDQSADTLSSVPAAPQTLPPQSVSPIGPVQSTTPAAVVNYADAINQASGDRDATLAAQSLNAPPLAGPAASGRSSDAADTDATVSLETGAPASTEQSDATVALPPAADSPAAADQDQATVWQPALGGEQPTTDEGPDATTNLDGSSGPRPVAKKTVRAPGPRDTQRAGPLAGADATAIQGYEILGVLGRGAMGVVYKARQVGLNRLTALKMILSGVHAGKEEIARFRGEGEAVARLQHPNIVQIYEVGEHTGLPYFSLEFVDGGSLQAKLDGSPMHAQSAARLMVQLGSAMHYAHQRHIIHRDLKPANILMTSDGVAKISDFGLAKKLEGEAGHTTTGAIMGTPSYMAPEQAAGKTSELGPSADIYSLGAILYELLTGRPPFRGETVLDTLQLVQHTEPVPPSRLQPRVPRDLETICLKCLRKEPYKRFETAQDLADDLERFLANQPIKARRVPPWERAWKWARRRPAVAALLATLVLVLTGSFIGLFGLWRSAEDSRQHAESARKDAETAQAAAEAQKIAAVNARNEALANAKREAEAKALAQKNYERSVQILYATHMSLAQKALADGQIRRARELLDDLAKRSDGGQDLRGFEWHYLERLCRADRLVTQGHANLVTDVVFSPDATKIATASLDQKVKIWEVASGRVLQTLGGHRRPVRCVVFSDDATLVATGSADGTVKIWKVASGELLQTLDNHTDLVHTVAFSADARLLASGSEDRTIIVWDVATGKPLKHLSGHKYGVTSVAFDPKATKLASGGADKNVLLWDLAKDGAAPEVLGSHGHWVTSVAFDREGKRIASGSLDETVSIWNVEKRERLRTLTDAAKPIRAVAFSPGGSQLAALSRDSALFVWDLTVTESAKKLEARPGVLRTIAFSQDGERMASVSFDTRAWDTNTVLTGPVGAISAVAFQPGSALLASAGGTLDAESHQYLGEINLWNSSDRKQKPRRLLAHKGPVRALAFSADGKSLLSGGEDDQALLWDVEKGNVRATWTHHSGWINALAFQPNGDLAASASEDGKAFLFDVTSRFQPIELAGHGRPVRCVAFSPDGKKLATGAAGGMVKIWDVATGQELKTIAAHAFGVTGVAFSPDGHFLATCGEDQLLKLWNLASEQPPLRFEGHTDTVTAIAFGDGGRRLFSASADQTVKVWDTSTAQETLSLRGHTGGVTCLALSPSGQRLASGSWDASIRIWEAGPAEDELPPAPRATKN
jgi:eukaryotic-like serine/threonine-protein kinase